MASAARTLTDAGVLGSINVFSKVVAAAEVLESSDSLSVGGTPCLPVGSLEFGYLKPIDQGSGRNTDHFGSLFDVPLGQQGGDCLLFFWELYT
jgi:hypothetical protein